MPYRKRLTLDTATARSLRKLVKWRRSEFGKPDLTEEQVVASLVEQEWQAIDQMYQKAAEIAQEPYIF